MKAPDAVAPTEVKKEVVGKCCGCSIPWSKYRGKKRCPVCGVPLLLCTDCIKNDADKKGAVCALCQADKELGRQPFNKKKHYADVLRSLGEGGNDGDEAEDPVLGKRSREGSKVPLGHVCGVCSEAFKSRNLLFRHIKETGHANRKSKKKTKA